MGLDSYLLKYPRFKNYSVNELNMAERYFQTEYYKDQKQVYDTFMSDIISTDEFKSVEKDLSEIKSMMHMYYPCYDKAHEYGNLQLYTEVAYWRKEWAIHNWFVAEVQGGNDDCTFHNEVTKECLERFVEFINGKLKETERYSGTMVGITNSKHKYLDESFEVVVEDDIGGYQLLKKGDFITFSRSPYDDDELGMYDRTLREIKNIIKETDFDTEMIYYISSW